jgi:hypothetical protein
MLGDQDANAGHGRTTELRLRWAVGLTLRRPDHRNALHHRLIEQSSRRLKSKKRRACPLAPAGVAAAASSAGSSATDDHCPLLAFWPVF